MAPMPAILLIVPALLAALVAGGDALGLIHAQAAAAELLGTALVLGIRHGIDWDHIAAITDITSTTAAAEHGEQHHALDHLRQGGHVHAHGGPSELCRTRCGWPALPRFATGAVRGPAAQAGP